MRLKADGSDLCARARVFQKLAHGGEIELKGVIEVDTDENWVQTLVDDGDGCYLVKDNAFVTQRISGQFRIDLREGEQL